MASFSGPGIRESVYMRCFLVPVLGFKILRSLEGLPEIRYLDRLGATLGKSALLIL